jgi:hypothetical protein
MSVAALRVVIYCAQLGWTRVGRADWGRVAFAAPVPARDHVLHATLGVLVDLRSSDSLTGLRRRACGLSQVRRICVTPERIFMNRRTVNSATPGATVRPTPVASGPGGYCGGNRGAEWKWGRS